MVAANGDCRQTAEGEDPSHRRERAVATEHVLRDGDICAVDEAVADEQEVAERLAAGEVGAQGVNEVDDARRGDGGADGCARTEFFNTEERADDEREAGDGPADE